MSKVSTLVGLAVSVGVGYVAGLALRDRPDIAVWEDENTSNVSADNACKPPDYRVRVPKSENDTIYERHRAGETQEQIAGETMSKKRRKKYGFSFSWRRALGVQTMKQKIARATGIPTTEGGRRRKVGRLFLKLFGIGKKRKKR